MVADGYLTTDAEGMIEEGRHLASLHENVVVKTAVPGVNADEIDVEASGEIGGDAERALGVRRAVDTHHDGPGADGGAVAAIRVGDWKAVYLENRAHQLQVWREPFIKLRLPLIFNLRRDPFEKAQHNSNTYHDWVIDRAYMLGPMQVVASKFLLTLKDYPPSQTPGDWSLATLEAQIKNMTVGGR